jgi:hypothetical protein
MVKAAKSRGLEMVYESAIARFSRSADTPNSGSKTLSRV